MGHYKSNVRDLEFNLFEVLDLGEVLDSDPYGDMDSDVVRMMLAEVRRIAEGLAAEPFAEIDRSPPTFDPQTHTVRLPDGLTAAYRAGYGAGWDKIGIAEELGGTPMRRPVVWALIEMLIGANPAAHMYANGAWFGDIFFRHATEEQKRWARIWVEHGWGSSMVLTEPDAGSDVGAGRTKAIAQPDRSWHIEGVKRFITSGDSGDLVRQHRPPRARPARRSGPRYQGLEPVRRTEVPVRLGDR